MKKKVWISIVAATVALAAIGAALLWLVPDHKTPGHGNVEDIEWYDPGGTEFEIADVDMLYDVAVLSYHYDFAGQTLKLTADITVNTGDAAGWEKKAPAWVWTPITNFAGTFDGQGHTVSGLYAKTYDAPTALFANAQSAAVVRDLRVENSLFLTAGDLGSASVAAASAGTYQRIYSNAIIRCNYGSVGGLFSRQSGNLIAEECWFDGEVETSHRTVGGIADCADAAELVLNHCLNTGKIINTWSIGASNAGGLVGMTYNGGRLVINDSFSSGELALNNLSRSGSIMGGGDASSYVTFLNTFGVLERFDNPVSDQISNRTGGPVVITEKNLLGVKAYQWADLDFENHWSCVEGSTPVLTCFTEQPLDLSGVKRAVDYDWYDENASELVIRDLSQLYAFALLSYNTDYVGKTVKLDGDFTLNDGLAENWIENAPENLWYPVQWFGGIFDGQGHTLSGLYAVGNSSVGLFSRTKSTALLKNFRLENSLMKVECGGTGSNAGKYALSGAIVGRGAGTFDSIYTDAIVYAKGGEIGGILGQANVAGMIINITNCWFDGKLMAVGDQYGYMAGGIVGGHVLGTINMAHCLSTGTIHTEVNFGSQAGGLVGVLMNDAILNVSDCLTDTKFETANPYYVGGAIGVSYGNATTVLSNTYAARESVEASVGEYVSHNWSVEGTKMTGAAIPVYRRYLTGTGAARWTGLNFEKFWVLRPDGLPVPATLYKGETVSADGIARAFSFDWYNADQGGGTIRSTADYIGFTMLSWTTDFAGKTIRLGTDVTLNSGDASTWGKAAPNVQSIPMHEFAGTFDGQGHTISGVYQKEPCMLGLFAKTAKTAVIRNFRLVNSYFDVLGRDVEKSGILGLSGSVVGRGGGTLDTIYSSAIIRAAGYENGGMIGQINLLDVSNRFNNLWFDGTIYGVGEKYGYYAGGIAGGVMRGINTFSNCLFTGSIKTDVSGFASKVGGIVASAENKCSVVIRDCLSAGTLECGNPYYKGAIMGTMYPNTTVTISNCFADSMSALGNKGQFVSAAKNENVSEEALQGSAIPVSTENLTGLNGYRWTTLDFNKYWAARDGACPGLKSFVGKPLPTSSTQRMVDLSWYSASAKTLTVDSAADLYGLYLVSFSDNFSGKTVKLGADITVNSGDASTWGTQAPAYSWTPIASFAGTLDGAGHTISGIYVKETAGNDIGFISTLKGGTVRNLKLTNSYVEGGTESMGVGGLVGAVDGGGTIDTVYCSAIVNAGYYNNGGFVGRAINTGTLTITNSQFGGTVTGTGYNNAGFVGASVHNGTVVEITNCLMSGAVTIEPSRITGGILANRMNGSTVSISDTLVSGTVHSGGGATGAIVGTVNSGTVTLTNVYATAESTTVASGSVGAGGVGAGTPTGTAVILSAAQISGTNGYRNTELDFKTRPYWAAVADASPALTAFFTGTALDISNVTKPDTSWYDGEKAEFTLTTAAQLEGFMTLSKTDNFAGKTVKLGADIDLNPGWTAGSEAPDTVWQMIGAFAGTLDGDGYTVSGVYVKAVSGNDVGFISVLKGGTVRDLKLTNSYMEGSAGTNGIGGLVGAVDGGGTIDTVYVSATVNAKYYNNGGFVGRAINTGTLTITNSQFDGTVTGTGYNNAGFVGGSVHNGTVVEITNCLMSGAVTIEPSRITGGILANRMNGSTVSISDTLVSGTVHSGGGGQTGAVAGQLNSGTITLQHVYATAESCAVGSGGIGAGTPTGMAVIYPAAKLTGVGAYQRTELDFKETPYWSAVEGEMPALTAFFTGTALDLTDVSDIAPDVEIGTAAELLAFAASSKTDDYAGKLIVLTADIDLQGTENFPMIGAFGGNYAAFKGDFDGQNHTVSNVTITSNEAVVGFFRSASGGAIRNLKLDGITVTSTETGTGRVGALVGNSHTGGGTYENITVKNASVNGAAGYVGGVIGASFGNLTMKDCSFSGTVAGKQHVGGVLGYTINGAQLTDCTASVAVTATQASGSEANVGGLVGWINGGATVTGATVSGTVHSNGGYQAGGVVGRISGNTTISKTDCTAALTADSGNHMRLGGIVGSVWGSVTATIQESRFGGSIVYNGTGSALGGFAGIVINAATVLKVENCLMDGSVSSTAQTTVGGILAHENGQTGGSVTISKTLVTGTVQSAGGGQTGALIGNSNNRPTTITDTYYNAASCTMGTDGIGIAGSNLTNNAASLTAEQLTGDAAAINAVALDFGTVWMTQSDKFPALCVLVKEEA